jgi:hypothetical protein
MPSNVQLFLGDKPILESYLGDKFTEYNISSSLPAAPITIPQAGLQFWLDPTSYSGSGSKWLSTYGNATGSFTGSYIYSGSTFFNMNTTSVCQFNTTASLDYGAQPNTLFAVGRSSGSATDQHGRLLAGQNNWLMGTYGGGGGAGVNESQRAYYDGQFVINDTPYDTQWRVYTAVWQNSASASFFVNGVKVAESTTPTNYGFNNFSINNGAFQTGTAGGFGENTQADYGDIILYSRVLTSTEIAQVYDVIKSKYGLT